MFNSLRDFSPGKGVSSLLLDDALKPATPLIAPLVSGVAGLSVVHAAGFNLGLPRVLEYSSSTRVVNYSSNFSTTRVLVNFYFRLQFFADTVRIVGIYANLGLRDFICNMLAWK